MCWLHTPLSLQSLLVPTPLNVLGESSPQKYLPHAWKGRRACRQMEFSITSGFHQSREQHRLPFTSCKPIPTTLCINSYECFLDISEALSRVFRKDSGQEVESLSTSRPSFEPLEHKLAVSVLYLARCTCRLSALRR